ncbi:MAG TPA: PAS domain S-box protein, partial [Nannocystis sp.]
MAATQEFKDVVRAVFNQLDLMAWAIDTGGQILFSEGAALKNIGVEPGGTVGYNIFELYGSSENVGDIRRGLAGHSHSALTRIDGRTLETRYEPMRDEADAITGMVGITRDITEQVNARDTLDRQTLAMREQAELLDLAHDAIRVRRLDGTITYWNQGAERVFGHKRDDAIGKHVHALLRTEPVTGDLAAVERQLLTNGFWEGELTQRRSDGQEVLVASRWVLKRGATGERDAVLEIDTDITARRRAEEAEARRQQEIIRAQAQAIEELSTPLIPIADEILVMPLIGMMDAIRAQQVMHSLLTGLAASRGKFAILDITGVPVVDTA